MENWINREEKVLLGTYQRMPLVISHGKGSYLYDESGEGYLDMFSGLAVSALGHCHPALVEEGKKQLETYMHISNFFYCKKGISLGEKIIERTFPGKVFFTNSGTESVEAAIKYLFNIGKEKGKTGIVTFRGSFHGRTLGALGLTKIDSVAKDFPTADYPVYEISRQGLEDLEALFKEKKPVGMLLELISGSGGVEVTSKGDMAKIADLCRQYEVLLCIDEIQTGIGRTGKLFAYEHYDLEPDLVVFAKAIGGGNPLGGMIVNKNIDGYFEPGDHGTTFGPSPLSAALGSKVLEMIDSDFLRTVEMKGNFLRKGLENLHKEYPKWIKEVRGSGLMVGVEFQEGKDRIEQLKKYFLEEKVLINITRGNVLRLLPPLIISEEELQQFLDVFARCMKKTEAS